MCPMRLVVLLSFLVVVVAKNVCDLSDIPMLYLNMDKQSSRRAAMESEFPHAIRVPAVNGHQEHALETILDFEIVEPNIVVDRSIMLSQFQRMMRLTQNMTKPLEKSQLAYLDEDPKGSGLVFPYTRPRKLRPVPKDNEALAERVKSDYFAYLGEAGATLSHLKALLEGYRQGWEYFLVAEDDLGSHLCSFHLTKIPRIIELVQKRDPAWELIRLQWFGPLEDMETMMVDHVTAIRDLAHPVGPRGSGWNSTYEETVGDWKMDELVRPLSGMWGTTLNLWSRAGAIRHLSLTLLATGKFACSLPCIADSIFPRPDEVWRTSTASQHIWVPLPPLYLSELGDEGTGIRGTDSHYSYHLSASALVVGWYLQLSAVVKKYSEHLYPIKSHWRDSSF